MMMMVKLSSWHSESSLTVAEATYKRKIRVPGTIRPRKYALLKTIRGAYNLLSLSKVTVLHSFSTATLKPTTRQSKEPKISRWQKFYSNRIRTRFEKV